MKTLAELQERCAALGIAVSDNGRPRKEAYMAALRDYYWCGHHPDQPLPEQIVPMLLGDWQDLSDEEAAQLEQDDNGWCLQPKLDGVRALLHIMPHGVRITGRCVSEVTYRLGEFQDNLPHLTTGWRDLAGTVLDGELICPVAQVNTGQTMTASPLQAAVAIVATSPENAAYVQLCHRAWLTFHAFDILRCRGEDLMHKPLSDRLAALEAVLQSVLNPHVHRIAAHTNAKALLHGAVIAEGGEGTVWKQLDQPYQPGRRVRHWIKRKAAVQLEAVVTGFKPGTSGKGHEHLVGAVEFSAPDAGGTVRPVAWVSNWTDETRQAMTEHDERRCPRLNPRYLGRKALLTGQDWSAKAQRLRSARLVRWL